MTGAGQGIGRAAASMFAGEGAQVVASTRTVDKLLSVHDPLITPRQLDVTDHEAVNALIAADGPFHIIVNCAGMVANGTILDCDEATWAASFETNVTSVYRVIKAALPGMLELGGGSIVNVASVASSVTGVDQRFAYGASKAAMIGLTKAIARDFIRQNIRCNALCPGTTLSPSLEDRIEAAPDPIKMRRLFTERQPMGRLGTLDEMAAAIVFLSSDEAAFMTGQLLVIDGGQTL
ncbi:MAG: SDR family oxidoreductase [Pseudomonadota bacterium]